MVKTPIEEMLDTQIEWIACDGPVEELRNGIPYATHSGVLDFGGLKLRCYRLNDGRTIFAAGDVEKFFTGSENPSDVTD